MIFLKEKEKIIIIIIIKAEINKKDDMQVKSNPKSNLRISLAYHRLERGQVTRGFYHMPRES